MVDKRHVFIKSIWNDFFDDHNNLFDNNCTPHYLPMLKRIGYHHIILLSLKNQYGRLKKC